MKNITIENLVTILADKCDLTFEAKNFKELYHFAQEIYPALDVCYTSLDEQSERAHNVNAPERCITLPTEVLKAVFDEAEAKFDWSGSEADYFDGEDEEFNVYSSPDELNGKTAIVNYVDGNTSMAEFLKYWQEICRRFGCEIDITAGDDDECTYCNHMLKWHITANQISSEGSFFEIADDNDSSLTDSVYWLCQNFYEDSFEEFNRLGVEIRYENNNDCAVSESGKKLCLQYIYGNKANLMQSYDEALTLVKKYPIVFSVLPDNYKDKQMVTTFLVENGKWIRKYKEMCEAEDIQLKKDWEQNHTICSLPKGRFLPITNNAIVDELVDLGEWTKDVDILVLAMQNDCYGDWDISSVGRFQITENNYDEKAFKEAIKLFPQIVCRVYYYWVEHIKNYPKIIESIRVRYELYNQPNDEELALFHCFDMIESSNEKAISQLFSAHYILNYAAFNPDHVEVIKKIFARLDVSKQNLLASMYYYYAKYISKADMDKDLEKIIATDCPIAANILSDAAILKYNLKDCVSDDEAIKSCAGCQMCSLVRMKCK